MKIKTLLLLALFSLGSFVYSPSRAMALDASDVAGSYELKGMMEMAGMIVLKADQKYQAGFSYGAADWVEEGTWKLEGEVVVLSGGHFKTKNSPNAPQMLAPGTRLSYKSGKLENLDPERKLTFVNPNNTPSNRKKTGEAGEGRMLVQGKVMKIDSDTMMVKVKGECIDFAVGALSPDVLKVAKKGATLDVEIPYSAILGGESCPSQ